MKCYENEDYSEAEQYSKILSDKNVQTQVKRNEFIINIDSMVSRSLCLRGSMI